MNNDAASRRHRGISIAAALILVGALGGCRQETTSDGTPSPAPSATETSSRLDVYLHSGNPDKCDEVVAASRTVEGVPTLLLSMRALVQGPTADERARGLAGWFTDATAQAVRSAEIRDGVATVDFTDLRQLIPNASTSCGSQMLLAQLDRTAKQFPAVTATRYSINGSATDFYEWLQFAVPAE